MASYRERIYERYATTMHNLGNGVVEEEARAWGRPYRHYLCGWLPSEKNAAILDAGCGAGRLLQFLADNGYTSVEGVDLSAEQVTRSRHMLPKGRVHQGDVLAFLERRANTYDVVFGLDIVEHFDKEELLRFLDAVYRALRPGGRIVLQTPNAGSPYGCECRYGDLTHEIGFSANLLCRLLTLVGFELPEVREAGPVAHGVKSAIRVLLWQLIRGVLLAWNYIERGCGGDRVFTRVMLASARKPDSGHCG